MKKLSVFVFLFFYCLCISSQTINVHLKNGQTVEYPSNSVEYINFTSTPIDPSVTAGEAIDLGLSVKWSSCNLGATTPEGYGAYYSWGETTPKDEFRPNNYAYYDNEKEQYIDIGNDISGTPYDAARVNLGDEWRMPTNKEMNELIDKCKWEWSSINKTNGYLITGKNGNSIFLPAAERGQEGKVLSYWTSTLSSELIVLTLNAYSGDVAKEWPAFRYYGLSIRPVK